MGKRTKRWTARYEVVYLRGDELHNEYHERRAEAERFASEMRKQGFYVLEVKDLELEAQRLLSLDG